jgi:hypothetical protein
VDNVWELLKDVFVNLGLVLAYLVLWVLRWSLVIAWFAWWLWCVNWTKAWPILRQGGWAVVVLLVLTASLVWAQVAPDQCTCLGFVVVPNFWWQLGAVSLLTTLTLFCGWLQGVFGWAPSEISLDPAEEGTSGHEEREHH